MFYAAQSLTKCLPSKAPLPTCHETLGRNSLISAILVCVAQRVLSSKMGHRFELFWPEAENRYGF